MTDTIIKSCSDPVQTIMLQFVFYPSNFIHIELSGVDPFTGFFVLLINSFDLFKSCKVELLQKMALMLVIDLLLVTLNRHCLDQLTNVIGPLFVQRSQTLVLLQQAFGYYSGFFKT
jgi:hypothetical protein